MNSTVGIKADRFTALVAKTVRQYEDVSMSEIKARIDNDDYIFKCDYIDGKGIKNILEIYRTLTKADIKCELSKNGSPVTTEYLMNTLGSYKITEEWTEYVMDMEARAEEEE